MRLESFSALLAISILLVALVTLPLLASSAVAKPIEPNPEHPNWENGTLWGTYFEIENHYVPGNVNMWMWPVWGVKTGDEIASSIVPLPPPEPWLSATLVQNDEEYGKIVKSRISDPQSYSWYVKLYSSDPSVNGILWWELENADTWFVPPDFSVVLENIDNTLSENERVSLNLRRNLNYPIDFSHVPWPWYATLYVDNAVDATISPSSRTGTSGDDVSFTVTVSNTGRHDDNYSLGADAGGWPYTIVPSSLSISAGNSATATLTVTLGADAKVISVTADGTYAEDNAACTAIALPLQGVDISVSPSYQSGLRGSSLSYTVVVRNASSVSGTYSLTVADNAGWFPSLSPTSLTVLAGENRTATLSVTVPENSPENTRDSITVVATSSENTAVKDNASCIAQAIADIRRGVQVSISPNYQENENGKTLTYTVTVTNTGNITEDFNLAVDDDAGWSLTLPSTVTNVVPDENRQVTLTVGIPATAENCTHDNITVIATSSENAAVSDSANCVAHCVVSITSPPPETFPWIYMGAVVVIIAAIFASILVILKRR